MHFNRQMPQKCHFPCSPCNSCSLGPPNLAPEATLDQFSRFCTAHGTCLKVIIAAVNAIEKKLYHLTALVVTERGCVWWRVVWDELRPLPLCDFLVLRWRGVGCFVARAPTFTRTRWSVCRRRYSVERCARPASRSTFCSMSVSSVVAATLPCCHLSFVTLCEASETIFVNSANIFCGSTDIYPLNLVSK